jgi:hypothetical protein
MAWKPKTIAGKILKGVVVGGASVLGVVAGTGIIGKAAGVVGNVVKNITGKGQTVQNKGTTALSTAGQNITSAIRKTVDKVKESAGNLLSGITKEQRDMIKAQKEETREYLEKLKTVDKLVNAGATPAEARAKVGIEPQELTEYDGEPIRTAGVGDILQNKNVLYALAGVAALFLLSKKRW